MPQIETISHRNEPKGRNRIDQTVLDRTVQRLLDLRLKLPYANVMNGCELGAVDSLITPFREELISHIRQLLT